MGEIADKYGPWAIVVGASDGCGALFAERLAREGVDVVLVARRQHVLQEVATGIAERTGATTRTLAVDLTDSAAAQTIIDATADLDIGMLVYCAGADPNYQPFLDNPVTVAEALLQRNCLVLMRLCHHYAGLMVARGRGGIVNFSSGAALAGGPNMVAYGATKAFDLLFTEGLWSELHDEGIDVLCLLLGMTDTPALRQLARSRGQIASLDEVPPGAIPAEDVIDEAFDNLTNGPTLMVGDMMRMAEQVFKTLSRNDAVKMVNEAGAQAMGSN